MLFAIRWVRPVGGRFRRAVWIGHVGHAGEWLRLGGCGVKRVGSLITDVELIRTDAVVGEVAWDAGQAHLRKVRSPGRLADRAARLASLLSAAAGERQVAGWVEICGSVGDRPQPGDRRLL